MDQIVRQKMGKAIIPVLIVHRWVSCGIGLLASALLCVLVASNSPEPATFLAWLTIVLSAVGVWSGIYLERRFS